MTDIDILSKVPDEMLTAAASRFPDAAAATENLQRVILRLPDGHRAEVTFARISEKEGRLSRGTQISPVVGIENSPPPVD
jgi:hypothetical protein